MGGWDQSSWKEERSYNIQSACGLFVDIRIPKSKPKWLENLTQPGTRNIKEYDSKEDGGKSELAMLDDLGLRMYARQHAFGGMTVVAHEKYPPGEVGEQGRRPPQLRNEQRPVCTRHHCIDWNFVGKPRSRPNKWWVEFHPLSRDVWKEWAYATDEFGQHYYCEQWERLSGDDGSAEQEALALRKAAVGGGRDGILVVVGDHFNYIHDRMISGFEEQPLRAASLVELVDAAIASGDRQTAEAYLTLDAGHGIVSSGWIIDCAIQSWRQGTALFDDTSKIRVSGDCVDTCQVIWNGEVWDVYECSFASVHELDNYFKKHLHGRQVTSSL